MVLQLPVWLHGLPPVVDAQHDGEGAGGQHLLVVVVVQAVRCCQGKSVPNLFDSVIQQIRKYAALKVYRPSGPRLLGRGVRYIKEQLSTTSRSSFRRHFCFLENQVQQQQQV